MSVNVADVLSGSLLGKLIRAPLGLLPRNLVVPVVSGPLRGARWIVGSHRHACWLGIYEPHIQNLIVSAIGSNAVFYDIGANVGFYSLLAARVAGAGRIYAFEPLPRNLEYLNKHLEMNRVRNGTVLDVAVSDRCGESLFSSETTGAMGSLGATGDLRVRTVNIDALIAQQQIASPDCIKMDIEGAEALALRGAESCFKRHRPRLFLATHGSAAHNECCQLLTSWGYIIQILDASEPDRADLFAYAA